jgi:hypothetical protein
MTMPQPKLERPKLEDQTTLSETSTYAWLQCNQMQLADRLAIKEDAKEKGMQHLQKLLSVIEGSWQETDVDETDALRRWVLRAGNYPQGHRKPLFIH